MPNLGPFNILSQQSIHQEYLQRLKQEEDESSNGGQWPSAGPTSRFNEGANPSYSAPTGLKVKDEYHRGKTAAASTTGTKEREEYNCMHGGEGTNTSSSTRDNDVTASAGAKAEDGDRINPCSLGQGPRSSKGGEMNLSFPSPT